MPQIINEQSLGGRLGESLGSGLQTGLQALANMKLNQLSERTKFGKTSEALKGLGYSQEQANQLAGLPDPILTQVLRQNAQERLWGQEANIFNSLLGQQNQPQQQQMNPQQIMQQQGSSQLNVSPLDQQVNQGPQNNVITGQNKQQEPVTLANLSKVGALRPGSAIPLAKHFQDVERHKENVALKKDIHNENVANKLGEKLEGKASVATQLKNEAQDALKLVKAGRALTGIKGKITPEWLQTPDGQKLMSAFEKIVSLNAQTGKGIPSVARLKTERNAKAQIWQQPEAIEHILNKIINDEIITTDIAKYDAFKNILEENSGKNPGNIYGLVNSKSKEILKENKNKSTSQRTFDELPPAKDFRNKIATNPSTGQRVKSINDEWVPVEEES